MKFFRIIALQALLLFAAALVAKLIGGVLMSSSSYIFARPIGLLVVTLINTMHNILLGSALSCLRYMTALRINIVTLIFAALITTMQCLAIFVAAPSIHFTRYIGNVPLFLDGAATSAGIIVQAVDIFAATAAFFLASSLTGTYRKVSNS